MKTILDADWNIDQIIQENPYVILQFGTDSCGPCHAIWHKLEDWSESHTDVAVVYIPIETYLEQAVQMGILSSPTVLTYIDGKLFQKESGYFSLEKILDRLEYLMVEKNGNDEVAMT